MGRGIHWDFLCFWTTNETRRCFSLPILLSFRLLLVELFLKDVTDFATSCTVQIFLVPKLNPAVEEVKYSWECVWYICVFRFLILDSLLSYHTQVQIAVLAWPAKFDPSECPVQKLSCRAPSANRIWVQGWWVWIRFGFRWSRELQLSYGFGEISFVILSRPFLLLKSGKNLAVN